MRTIHVNAWEYGNGDGCGGGGFNWFPTEAPARDEFEADKGAWTADGGAAYLLAVDVPAELVGDEITRYLDARIWDAFPDGRAEKVPAGLYPHGVRVLSCEQHIIGAETRTEN